jgi:preprotein translocase subunit SecE
MAKKEAKTNKENKHFFKEFKAEIKKVIWPTQKQLVNSTTAVIVMVLVVALTVFVLDLAFDAFNEHALTKLQEVVQSTSIDDSSDDTAEISDSSDDVDETDNAETETTDSETDADSNE